MYSRPAEQMQHWFHHYVEWKKQFLKKCLSPAKKELFDGVQTSGKVDSALLVAHCINEIFWGNVDLYQNYNSKEWWSFYGSHVGIITNGF